ncbi:hypothetical protein ACWDCB_11830 [Streptomyces sp. NPDC001178]
MAAVSPPRPARRARAGRRRAGQSVGGFARGAPDRPPGDANAQRAGRDAADDRGGQQEGIAVDADRDPRGIGVDDHLVCGQRGESAGVRAARQIGRPGHIVDLDPEDAERARIQPGAATEAVPSSDSHQIRPLGHG